MRYSLIISQSHREPQQRDERAACSPAADACWPVIDSRLSVTSHQKVSLSVCFFLWDRLDIWAILKVPRVKNETRVLRELKGFFLFLTLEDFVYWQTWRKTPEKGCFFWGRGGGGGGLGIKKRRREESEDARNQRRSRWQYVTARREEEEDTEGKLQSAKTTRLRQRQGRLVKAAGRRGRRRGRGRPTHLIRRVFSEAKKQTKKKKPQLPGKIFLLWLCDLLANRIVGGVKPEWTPFSPPRFIDLTRWVDREPAHLHGNEQTQRQPRTMWYTDTEYTAVLSGAGPDTRRAMPSQPARFIHK